MLRSEQVKFNSSSQFMSVTSIPFITVSERLSKTSTPSLAEISATLNRTPSASTFDSRSVKPFFANSTTTLSYNYTHIRTAIRTDTELSSTEGPATANPVTVTTYTTTYNKTITSYIPTVSEIQTTLISFIVESTTETTTKSLPPTTEQITDTKTTVETETDHKPGTTFSNMVPVPGPERVTDTVTLSEPPRTVTTSGDSDMVTASVISTEMTLRGNITTVSGVVSVPVPNVTDTVTLLKAPTTVTKAGTIYGNATTISNVVTVSGYEVTNTITVSQTVTIPGKADTVAFSVIITDTIATPTRTVSVISTETETLSGGETTISDAVTLAGPRVVNTVTVSESADTVKISLISINTIASRESPVTVLVSVASAETGILHGSAMTVSDVVTVRGFPLALSNVQETVTTPQDIVTASVKLADVAILPGSTNTGSVSASIISTKTQTLQGSEIIVSDVILSGRPASKVGSVENVTMPGAVKTVTFSMEPDTVIVPRTTSTTAVLDSASTFPGETITVQESNQRTAVLATNVLQKTATISETRITDSVPIYTTIATDSLQLISAGSVTTSAMVIDFESLVVTAETQRSPSGETTASK
jgi:hypothetical protein